MSNEFVNLDTDNIASEHLCCAIADKKHQHGVDVKRTWLTDRVADGHVFRKLNEKGKVDMIDGEYELMALSFDGSKPEFATNAKKQSIDSEELTIYYGLQCPYIPNCIEQIETFCNANDISVKLIKVDTLEKAKELPCVFNNWAVFYRGKFETVHLLNEGHLKKMLDR